jgi:hypothetical protein
MRDEDNADGEFSKIFEQAVAMAASVDVQPTQPRIAGRQAHRSNIHGNTPEVYYKLNLFLPFMDHLNAELEGQFSGKKLLL